MSRMHSTTALVSLSHTAFKSSYTYDMTAITALAHDAGAMTSGDIAERIKVKLQRTRQRALGIASPRMHDHIRLLVDDDDRVIFVQDIQRQVLRHDVRFFGVRQLNPDSIIHPQPPR